ncbi:MAG: hypothetical protein FJY19_02500 [Bacteroidetes bacterium]|nr:hypothetical protein [Bacteroidota bacterium]
MYEKKNHPLASRSVFMGRIKKNLYYSAFLICFSLLFGTIGYHTFCASSWIDSFHNASMILSGMGPVITITTFSGKLFSSFYALFSGFVLITNMGLILAPLLHRVMHHFHLEE